jgi:methylamine dehydrogenase heavy chain
MSGRPASALARRWRRAACGIALLALTTAASAEVPIEELGRVEGLPEPPGPHWVWVGDPVLERSSLVDLDSGDFLGMVDGGFGIVVPLVASSRPEVYVAETHYSRGSRGERTDVLTIYDRPRLAPVGEVVIPPKRAISAVPFAHAALTDDDRFVAIFNLTPATSLSIVDLANRSFAGEIETPGCSLVYPAGPRRLLSLCNDGGLLVVTLGEDGREASKRRSAPFFDPEKDPLMEAGARRGDRWYILTLDGAVHGIDLSGDEPRFDAPWSLLGEDLASSSPPASPAADRWRPGGRTLTAVHEATGRLFVLMHEGGGQETYKDPGSEVWVYDLDRRIRVARIELENPGPTFMGIALEFGADWIWPLDGLSPFVFGLLPAMVEEIAVTQDPAPLLVTSASFAGGLGVYDALEGGFLRRAYSGNLTNTALHAAGSGS